MILIIILTLLSFNLLSIDDYKKINRKDLIKNIS